MCQLGAAGPRATAQQTIARSWRSFSIRSSEERDRSCHHSSRAALRGGLKLSTGTRLYVACRSTPCCLDVWSRCVESSTTLGGWLYRVLKKTLEASNTTKVNYR